jgi:uncharacterized protein YuzE
MDNEINIPLNENQAIVLFELITELNKKATETSAEEIVISEIEWVLEKQLVETFDSNYREIVQQAKDKLEEVYYFKKEWLIELLKEQASTVSLDQLKKMKTERWFKKRYIRFVNSVNANQKDAKWQFAKNIILEHKIEGTIIVDILKDGRIGGFELYNELDS